MIKINVEKIAIERAKQNINLQELAQKTGLKSQTISNIERREVRPRLITVSKIAKALGKCVEDFLTIEEHN
jgi:DNA-binding XRE family transcriptional regulator